MKHGMRNTRVYSIWSSMKNRCKNVNQTSYKYYGGRGIAVCSEWEDFETFYADMGDPPDSASIDRIDNDGDYCPENCKWVTRKEQARNRRNNVLVNVGGISLTIAEWAEKTGKTRGLIWGRFVRHGWSARDAVFKPVRGRR